MKFTYWNMKTGPNLQFVEGKWVNDPTLLLGAYEAVTISEADKLFEAEHKLSPVKTNWVSVTLGGK